MALSGIGASSGTSDSAGGKTVTGTLVLVVALAWVLVLVLRLVC